jgi:hypothetical protein
MTKRGVTEIVGQGNSFDQVLIQSQLAGDGATHLSYFKAVGEAGAVEITLVIHENLGFVLETAEGAGVDDPVPVALEGAAIGGWLFRVGAPATPGRVGGVGR